MLSKRQPRNDLRKEAAERVEARNHELMIRDKGATERVEADNFDDTGNDVRVEECSAERVAGKKNTIAAQPTLPIFTVANRM